MRSVLLAISFALLPVPAGAGEHWAYAAPVDPTLQAGAAVHPIDQLLADAWKKAGLKPVNQAAPRRWIERAAYTLTGLPASAEQIQRIEDPTKPPGRRSSMNFWQAYACPLS